jgi:hypothetical protein
MTDHGVVLGGAAPSMLPPVSFQHLGAVPLPVGPVPPGPLWISGAAPRQHLDRPALAQPTPLGHHGVASGDHRET